MPHLPVGYREFKREIGLVEQKGANFSLILQSPSETVAGLTKKEDWPFTIICDPDGVIFRQYREEPGGIIKYLHPAGLIAAMRAMLQGYRHGKFEGKETQLPAVFVEDQNNSIKFTHYGEHIHDVPSPTVVAAHI